MTTPSLSSLRLDLKRAFTLYMLVLSSPAVADPTDAFVASYDYLATLLGSLGAEGFLYRLDDETTHLAAEVDQEIRRRLRESGVAVDYAEVEDRLRECFEYALGQLDTARTGPSVE